jgi:hypothetical protein
MVYESLELALGLRLETHGGVGQGLALTLFGVMESQFQFFPNVLLTSRGRVALLKAGLVLSHMGRGMFTVTMQSERCASPRSMDNLSGTRYPPQSTCSSTMPYRETSHKSSAVNSVGPQLPPQRPEGKMPY